MQRIWEIKQSTEKPDVLEVYIYGTVQGDSYDWWTDEIIESETSANHFRKTLAEYKDVSEIHLFVNSYGGSVYEGISIRNQLKRHSARVIGYVDGFACSIVSFILTGCDEVRMYSNTMQMIHKAWNWVAGNSTELRRAADDLDKIMEGNMNAYIEKANGKMTKEELIGMLDSGDTWLTAEECLELGLADSIIKENVDLTEAKKMLEQRTDSIKQQINYQKKLVALYQEMRAEPMEPTKEPIKKDPVPEEPVPEQNKLMNLFGSLSRKG